MVFHCRKARKNKDAATKAMRHHSETPKKKQERDRGGIEGRREARGKGRGKERGQGRGEGRGEGRREGRGGEEIVEREGEGGRQQEEEGLKG